MILIINKDMSMKTLFPTALLGMIFLFSGCGDSFENRLDPKKVALGERLFNDKRLSKNGNLSCATCHNPDFAFTDPDRQRAQNDFGAVSIGDDNVSLGDRNTPTILYAMFSAPFHLDDETEGGLWLGGQFHDGRAKNLKEQAKAPLLSPVEMRLETISEVVARIEENNDYVSQLRTLYGDDLFDDDKEVFDAVADAISTFEKSELFAPFSSRYDRYMNGEIELTPVEKWGLELFVREDKGNCTACHPHIGQKGEKPLFTDGTFDNLGVPVNEAVRYDQNNPLSKIDGYRDLGLGAVTSNPSLNGAFKVATLRNVAVTAPYMHNGVFKSLKTVVHFYNTRDVPGALNPDTGEPWRSPEIPETMNKEELGNLGLSDEEEDAIVSFLKTLTDRRYEYLLSSD